MGGFLWFREWERAWSVLLIFEDVVHGKGEGFAPERSRPAPTHQLIAMAGPITSIRLACW